MQKQILAHWLEGWSIEEIADKHNVTVEYTVKSIKEFWL